MMIYELNRGDRFTVPELPDLPAATFRHLDGMYCYAETDDGQIVNITGWTECLRETQPGDTK